MKSYVHKVGKRTVASVEFEWRPYNPEVIKLWSRGGIIPKGGFYTVMVKAGAGCKKYMKELLRLHHAGSATYEWPKFPDGDWKYQWAHTDGMHLWHTVPDADESETIDPAVLDEARRLLLAYVEANPAYFRND
jgi:hypothetical protein